MYRVTRNRDGSVPSLESIKRFLIFPGDLSHGEVVKALQESLEGIGLLATRLLTLDIKWLFQRTVAVVEISVEAFVEFARVEVHSVENLTIYILSHIPPGTSVGIHILKNGR